MTGPTLVVRKDARYECEGAVAELHEGEEWFRLRHGSEALRDSNFTAALTEREAVALMAVLSGAVEWFRSQPVKRAS